MSRARTILCLAIALLITSAFLVVAQDRIDVAAATSDSATRIPRAPLNTAVGRMDGPVEAPSGAEALEQNPYGNLDGVPTFGAFARTGSN
jgi:hypothetical protein